MGGDRDRVNEARAYCERVRVRERGEEVDVEKARAIKGGSRAEMSRRKAATQAGQVVGAFETRLLTGE